MPTSEYSAVPHQLTDATVRLRPAPAADELLADLNKKIADLELQVDDLEQQLKVLREQRLVGSRARRHSWTSGTHQTPARSSFTGRVRIL